MPIITGGAVVLLFMLIFAMGYVKAPPDTAYIISGLSKEPRVLIGRAGVLIPFLERKDEVYVGQMSVNINTEKDVPTHDFINVKIEAVAKVRIDPSVDGIRLAAKNFLNKSQEEIVEDLEDSLKGNMREIIGTLDLQALNTNRDQVSSEVMSKAAPDMAKLGIEVISCNIQNVTDEKNLISDLGADNTAKITKGAAIAKAQATMEVEIAKADADRQANDAKVKADAEIAIKNNELEIKKAELKKLSDIKRAEADAAYEIQKQEQELTIQTNTVNAQIARSEREIELKEREVRVKEMELEATINKKADAEKYEVEKKAEADLIKRMKEAEAKKYEQEKEADAKKYALQLEAEAQKVKAEAEKFNMEQEAAGIKAKGDAEASAIKAKGLAEAEAMEKKAEAYEKYGKAAITEMLVGVLPEIASKIAEPLSKIDKITIIGGSGSESGVGNVASNVPVVMAKLFESVKETTGVDLADVMKSNTYDAKVTRNINLTGLPESHNCDFDESLILEDENEL